jgi:hypothetical protein
VRRRRADFTGISPAGRNYRASDVPASSRLIPYREIVMRTAIAPLVLATALALAACSGDSPTTLEPSAITPTTLSASRAPSSSASRPIQGECALKTLSTVPYPAPPVFRQTAEGTCDFAHLGQSTVQFVQVVNFALGTQRSLTLVYTAANGDELRAASAGTSTASSTGVSFSSTITFLGGTGRFASATGSARAEGSANLAAGTSAYSLDGAISYDGADAGAK